MENNGTTYYLFQVQTRTYEAEITLVDNTFESISLVCDHEFVEEAISREITRWQEPLQRPELRILSYCHIYTDELNYHEIFVYDVKIKILGTSDDLYYDEVEIMDFNTFTEFLTANPDN